MTAFLRGIERRAALFAELQCGDVALADAALGSCLEAFVGVATRCAVADWPQRFWSMLLATPALREQSPAPQWPAAFSRLGTLGRGPRAALLLCLVARLSEDDAAAVLGIAQPTYRLALQRAWPSDSQGQPDASIWHALDDAARQALRALPATRLVRITRQREAALAGQKLPPAAARLSRSGATARGSHSPPRWLLPGLWAALAACALALVASFVLPGVLPGGDRDMTAIHRALLPPSTSPASRFDSDLALLSHRDFEQLADGQDGALIDGLDFYAWYAATLATQPAAPLSLPDAGQPLPEPGAAQAGRGHAAR